MTYKREEVIEKGKRYLKRKSIFLLICIFLSFFFFLILFFAAFVPFNEEAIERLGTAGVVGVIITIIFSALIPLIVFTGLYIFNRKRYKDLLMVGCIVCKDEIKNYQQRKSFDANKLYQLLKEKEKVSCSLEPIKESGSRCSRRTPLPLIIILTVFYSSLWFAMLCIIVGFFMPTPVRFFKKLNGTYRRPISSSTSKYGLSDDPDLDEIMFYDTVIDDD